MLAYQYIVMCQLRADRIGLTCHLWLDSSQPCPFCGSVQEEHKCDNEDVGFNIVRKTGGF